MSTPTINVREAASVLGVELWDLAAMLRLAAKDALADAVHRAGTIGGLPEPLIERANNFLAAIHACEEAIDAEEASD